MRPPWARLTAYLERLPQGVDSYPECRAKASAYREALARRPVPLDGLPPALQERLASPALVSAWIPEVHSLALGLAVADHHRMTDREYLDSVYVLSRDLLGGPTYRFLMADESPEAMLRHADVRWQAMHQGVGLSTERMGERACAYLLAFPVRLLDALLLQAFGQTFRASLSLSGAAEPRVSLVAHGETSARIEASW
jgi:hypothetical protein